ncbi:MAG: mandelate racemase/muconate lactonizing enzyme family protein [Phycisphaerae bacterium]
MKPTTLTTFRHGPVCFARIELADGTAGFGQLSTYDTDLSEEVLHRKIAPLVLGREFDDIPAVVDAAMEGTYKFPGTYVLRGLSGLETALWDRAGLVEDKPVVDLLGRRADAVAVYGSSMRRDVQPEEEARRMTGLRDQGYRAFKTRVGSVCGRDEDQWPGRSEKLIETVRQALGDQVDLMVDGNSCYSPEKAIQLGGLLESLDYYWFEEPCPYWKYDWTRQVSQALDIRVSGGEQDNYMPAWEAMIDTGVVDIVQPDICYLGGICRTLEVARRAAARGLPCVPHSANRTMVTVYALHLMASIEKPQKYLEYSIETTPWSDNVLTPELEVIDGQLRIPDRPGWGYQPHPDFLARAETRTSRAE